jgi:hypothetical protein
MRGVLPPLAKMATQRGAHLITEKNLLSPYFTVVTVSKWPEKKLR